MGKKREFNFRFSKHDDELSMIRNLGQRTWEVYYKDQLIDSFKYKFSMNKEFKKGRSYDLDDGANLVLCYTKHGAIYFWKPYLDGKLAYETLKSEHKYIWGSWVAAAILLPLLLILESADVRGAERAIAVFAIALFLINITCAFFAIIRWKPIAWIVAVLWVTDLIFSWIFFITNPVGLPPIMETIGIVIFRDFLINAKFIQNVLGELSEYEK